jgi:hypothetical protein
MAIAKVGGRTHDRAPKGSPNVAGSDTNGADGQKTELAFELLLVTRSVDHLANGESVVVRLRTRLLILIDTHSGKHHWT